MATLYSCKKYQDGPMISFRSKTERVANTWSFQEYMLNNVNVTSQITGTKLILTEGGNATFTYNGATSGSGTWQFADSKDNIIISLNVPNAYVTGDTTETDTFNGNILELKQNNMHLKGTYTINTMPVDPNNTGTYNIEWILTGSN